MYHVQPVSVAHVPRTLTLNPYAAGVNRPTVLLVTCIVDAVLVAGLALVRTKADLWWVAHAVHLGVSVQVTLMLDSI